MHALGGLVGAKQIPVRSFVDVNLRLVFVLPWLSSAGFRLKLEHAGVTAVARLRTSNMVTPRQSPTKSPRKSPHKLPIKKRRKEKPKFEPKRLFFDEIPENAVDHVLKFLGDSPRSEADDVVNVPGLTAVAVLQCGGALSTLARNAFRSVLCVNERQLKQAEQCKVRLLGTPRETRHAASHLPAEIGESLQALVVRAPLTSVFARGIAMHSTELRSLSFTPSSYWHFPSGHFCSILAARGSGLRHLSVEDMDANEDVVAAIGAHCRGLLLLKIWCRSVEVSFEPVWDAIGAGVQELELRHSRSSGLLALRKIPATCPRVVRLGLFFGKEGYDDVEFICKSYATKLLGLNLLCDSIGLPALNRIRAACPNSQITFPSGKPSKGCSPASTATVIALGSLSSSWTVSTSEQGFCNSTFVDVGYSCPNIRSICMTSGLGQLISEAAFGGLFILPKPKLRKFEVTMCDVSSASAVLSVLTRKARYLESFCFEGPKPALNILEDFIRSQTALRKVAFSGGWNCICHAGGNGVPWQPGDANANSIGLHWPPIISVLLSNPSLIEIACQCNRSILYPPRKVDDIANVCCPARARNLSISVCGWQYV